MPTTLAQDLLNNKNARLGVVGVYWAPEDTAYAAASGWIDLGVMDPGTFVPNFPREQFELMTGFPRAVKMVAITGTSGEVEFTLTEYTPYAAEIAAGSGPGVRTYASSPAGTTCASGQSVNGATLTSGTGFAVDMLVEVETANGLELTYVATKPSANVVTWKPPVSTAPTSGTFKAVKTVQQALGTSVVPRGAFKAEFLDQNGEKVTLYMPAASIMDGYRPNFGDATVNVKLPMKFKAYAKGATWNSVTHNVVGYIYHDFPNVT